MIKAMATVIATLNGIFSRIGIRQKKLMPNLSQAFPYVVKIPAW
jgi:hypothetical protein